MRFEGNERLKDPELARAIATTPSSWTRRAGLPFGARHCLDSLEFARDAYRLRFLYRQRGYYDAQVDTAFQRVAPRAVAAIFRIRENEPVRIDSLRVAGLDSVPGGERLRRLLLPFRGAVFDRIRLQATIDTVVERLHNMGYARAEQPLRNFSVVPARRSATVELEFLPGSRARIGAVELQITPLDTTAPPAIAPAAVRRVLSVQPGDIYRERDLYESQRDLYQLETYRHVEVALAPDSLQPPGDTLLTVLARLSEGPMHSVRLGAGWATLDCIRTQGRFTDRNFLGGARRLEVNARLTKIGVGAPLDGAESLCRGEVRRDPFSDTLNYYGGITIRQPTFFGPRNVPTLTLYSERRSEYLAYMRSTPFGGIFSVTREQQPRTPITLAYQLEFGRTVAEAAVFCSAFNICDAGDIAALNNRMQRLAVLGATISRDRTDDPFDPRRGYQATAGVRVASRTLGSNPRLQFGRVDGSAAAYQALGRSSVLAGRLQLGAVLATGSIRGAGGERFVPPQERLYGGGANSVRGFAQNQLGPVVYIVDRVSRVPTGFPGDSITVPDSTAHVRVSPTGGDALAVANLELRTRGPVLRDLVEWAIFMDVGQVWSGSRARPTLRSLRWTPGIGLRVESPVGPVRVDVAYNAYPRQKGAVYFEQLTAGQRQLVCVSPGRSPADDTAPSADCPATYAPAPSRSAFARLVFHFSIGQAF